MLWIRFAPYVQDNERAVIRKILAAGLSESQRILHEQSRVKIFYRLETPFRPLFVKSRLFSSWNRRLGRTLRKTKADREYQNLLSLRELGIPCPEPICCARAYRGPLIERSFLILEYLSDAVPLKHFFSNKGNAPGALMGELIDFFLSLRAKGIIHKDLQWNNILVTSEKCGHSFHLLDALHVSLTPESAQDAFLTTIAWFVHFLITGGAPQEVIDSFLDRAHCGGLEGGRGREWLLERAAHFKRMKNEKTI